MIIGISINPPLKKFVKANTFQIEKINRIRFSNVTTKLTKLILMLLTSQVLTRFELNLRDLLIWVETQLENL